MTVYAIAQLHITDRAAYARYQARFMGVLRQYRGRLLVSDDSPVAVEGEWSYEKVVVLAFADAAAFTRFAQSPEYERISVDRKAGSVGVVLLVDATGLAPGSSTRLPTHKAADLRYVGRYNCRLMEDLPSCPRTAALPKIRRRSASTGDCA